MVKKIIQKHHVEYEGRGEDIIIPLRKGEHRIMTLIQQYCRKTVSQQFVDNLEYQIARWKIKEMIIDLREYIRENK